MIKNDFKKCHCCNITKPLNQFHSYKNKDKIYYSYCIDCYKEKEKKRYITRKDYFENKKEETKEYNKSYMKKYYLDNKEKLIIAKKEYYIKNKNRIIKNQCEKAKEKRKNDKMFCLKEQARHIIGLSFNNRKIKKSKKSEEILGCNIDFFTNHLLKTFKKNYGYEYDNKEKIAIDHIIPLSTAKNEDDIIKLCHYKNLQLLKYKDNLVKSNKLEWKIGECKYD